VFIVVGLLYRRSGPGQSSTRPYDSVIPAARLEISLSGAKILLQSDCAQVRYTETALDSNVWTNLFPSVLGLSLIALRFPVDSLLNELAVEVWKHQA
jgi:hypothetical protein